MVEKNIKFYGLHIFHTRKNSLKYLYFTKAIWNAFVILQSHCTFIKRSKNPNSLTCKVFLGFKIYPFLCAGLLACRPAYLLAIRPTSSERIGPVFLMLNRYWHATAYLLFWLTFIYCIIVSPSSFIATLSLWLTKRQEIAKEVLRNCNGFYRLYH